jgi:hypothetical protein
VPDSHPAGELERRETSPERTPRTSRRSTASHSKRKQRISDTPSPLAPEKISQEPATNANSLEGGNIKYLETLFTLWKSAGRSVNLWDWLEGFRSTLINHEEYVDENDGDAQVKTLGKGKRKAVDEDDDMADAEGEANQARLHATFIRFCEEARMLGLVRARGKGTGKRGDEVVKGIGLV